MCVCCVRYPACSVHAQYYLWPALLYEIFPHYFGNGTIFEKRYWTWNVCFWVSLQLCLKRLTFWEELGEILSKTDIGRHVKYPLFSPDFNETSIFSRDLLKRLKCELSRQLVQWESSCSMRTDGQTWHSYLALSQFCESAKECSLPCGLLGLIILAKQFLMTDNRCAVLQLFVCFVVKHFVGTDGINKLWSDKY